MMFLHLEHLRASIPASVAEELWGKGEKILSNQKGSEDVISAGLIFGTELHCEELCSKYAVSCCDN